MLREEDINRLSFESTKNSKYVLWSKKLTIDVGLGLGPYKTAIQFRGLYTYLPFYTFKYTLDSIDYRVKCTSIISKGW